MPFGLYEIALVGRGPSGEAIVNTFHYRSLSEGEAAAPNTCDLVVNEFLAVVAGVFVLAVTDDYQGFQASCVCLSGANLGQEFTQAIIGTDGQLAGPSAPLQSTAIIRRRSAGGGRHGRGRLYISPIPEANTDVDGLYTDAGGVMDDLGQACLTNLTTLESQYIPCLLERADMTIRDLATASVSPIVGVMRSRRVRFPN